MTRRRANGEGSVYQRGNGRYVGEYEDADGKRRYVSGKSKAGARAKLKVNLKDKEEGIAVASQNLTVEKYLDQWLKSIRDTVRPGFFETYESTVRLHRKPTLGNTGLEKLNALQPKGSTRRSPPLVLTHGVSNTFM